MTLSENKGIFEGAGIFEESEDALEQGQGILGIFHPNTRLMFSLSCWLFAAVLAAPVAALEVV